MKKLLITGYLLSCNLAHAQLFNRGTTGLQKFLDGFRVIAPVGGTLVLAVIAFFYAKKMASNETIVRWLVGAILFGSSGEIANLFFG